MRSQMMSTRLSRYVFYFLCFSASLIGCVYQIHYLSVIYFRYATVNEVIFDDSRDVAPPVIAICSRPPTFLLTGTNTSVDEQQNLYAKLFRWPKRIFNASHASEGFLKNARLFGKTIPYLPQNWLHELKISKLISYEDLCYAIKTSPFVNKELSFWLSNETSLRLLDNDWEIKMYSRLREIPQDGHNEAGHFRFNTFTLSYDYYRSERLPPPHATQCRDYSRDGSMSRAATYDKCVKRQSNDTYGLVPSFVTFKEDEDYVMHSFIVATFGGPRLSEQSFDKIREDCKFQTRWKDCVQELYIPTIERFYKASRFEYLNTEFKLKVPSRPLIKALSKASVELVDYVTCVLSSISFWFAFSPLTFVTEGFLRKWLGKKLFVSKRSPVVSDEQCRITRDVDIMNCLNYIIKRIDEISVQ